MNKPGLAEGRTYFGGIIVESWRLWEGIDEDGRLGRRVSTWRLDSDYFDLAEDPGIAVVISQGSSLVADALERIAGAGATRVIRLGTTGGLQPDQAVGDLLLPYCAVRGEGTSRYYLPPDVPAVASLALVQSLASELQSRLATIIRPCVSWTTDGRWVESDDDIRLYSGLGVDAVDMETAALFAAAMARHVESASVSVIADLPVRNLGAEFKGLPTVADEWMHVVAQARVAFAAICHVLRFR